jgi:hypothetical protein
MRRYIRSMGEQAQKVRNEAIPQWAEGLYYDKGIFYEALVYYDEEAVYFECRDKGGKDGSAVRFSHEMLQTLKEVIEDVETSEDGASPQ